MVNVPSKPEGALQDRFNHEVSVELDRLRTLIEELEKKIKAQP